MTNRAPVGVWVAAYERAWRTPGTEPLAVLFDEEATYRASPYREPARGITAIAELWEREREGPDESFEMTHEIVAVEDDVAVVRVEVAYGRGEEYRDIWIIRFGPDGRCMEFEEWPFRPVRAQVPRGDEE